jgi:hypothetical protein
MSAQPGRAGKSIQGEPSAVGAALNRSSLSLCHKEQPTRPGVLREELTR